VTQNFSLNFLFSPPPQSFLDESPKNRAHTTNQTTQPDMAARTRERLFGQSEGRHARQRNRAAARQRRARVDGWSGCDLSFCFVLFLFFGWFVFLPRLVEGSTGGGGRGGGDARRPGGGSGLALGQLRPPVLLFGHLSARTSARCFEVQLQLEPSSFSAVGVPLPPLNVQTVCRSASRTPPPPPPPQLQLQTFTAPPPPPLKDENYENVTARGTTPLTKAQWWRLTFPTFPLPAALQEPSDPSSAIFSSQDAAAAAAAAAPTPASRYYFRFKVGAVGDRGVITVVARSSSSTAAAAPTKPPHHPLHPCVLWRSQVEVTSAAVELVLPLPPLKRICPEEQQQHRAGAAGFRRDGAADSESLTSWLLDSYAHLAKTVVNGAGGGEHPPPPLPLPLPASSARVLVLAFIAVPLVLVNAAAVLLIVAARRLNNRRRRFVVERYELPASPRGAAPPPRRSDTPAAVTHETPHRLAPAAAADALPAAPGGGREGGAAVSVSAAQAAADFAAGAAAAFSDDDERRLVGLDDAAGDAAAPAPGDTSVMSCAWQGCTSGM
jgi:hypothetical protein